MAYKNLSEVKYAFLEQFNLYLENNNISVESKEEAQNAMREFLKERLDGNNPNLNFEDSNPDLALWAYSYPPFIKLLPENGVDYDKNVASLTNENIERIKLENPEYAEWIAKNPKLNGKLNDPNALSEWNEYIKTAFTKNESVSAEQETYEEIQEQPVEEVINSAENTPEMSDEVSEMPAPVEENTDIVLCNQEEVKEIESDTRKVERNNKFKKIAIAVAALALVGTLASTAGAINNVEAPEEVITNEVVTSSNETLTSSNEIVTYEDYQSCVNYITSIMDRVNSEDANYTLARTSLSDSAAQIMPLMGLMDGANAGALQVPQNLIEGINNDGFLVPENSANVVIENTALTVSYMLVNHPDEIKLSDMVLGSVDKEILDGLQDRYNAVINAADEVTMKKALFELSEYEEKNCGSDGITHIIGNEVVGTVIPQKVTLIQSEKGWDIISSVSSVESYTPSVTEDGVFITTDESVNQIKMIDYEGNEIVDSGIGLLQEDIDALRVAYENGGAGACVYEGRGKFNSISSNPELNDKFKEFAQSAGLNSAFTKTQ